jgi:lysophospholipase L1-like esterase
MLGALVIFLGGAELLARAIDLRPAMGGAVANPPWLGNRWLLPREDYRDRLKDQGFLGRYYDLYEWDRWRFYRLRPNRDLELLDPLAPPATLDKSRWSVHTGPQGYRNPEYTPLPKPGERRVVALGDSSTFGWGVESVEAYPARLGVTLDRENDASNRWEVLNLGVPGYSSFQGLVTLARDALPLAPDVVLFSYLSNDGAMTGEPDRVAYARRASWLGALLELLHRSRAFETLEAWITTARAALGGAGAAQPRSDVRNVENYREAEGNLRAAVQTAQAANVPLVLVANCLRGPAAEVMARVAADTGTPYLDATALVEAAIPRIMSEPAFAKDRERLVQRYGEATLLSTPILFGFLPDACHPNAVGHRLIGDALAGIVEKTAKPRSAP